jgi:predicted transglutaminase-like cysteine proteinase
MRIATLRSGRRFGVTLALVLALAPLALATLPANPYTPESRQPPSAASRRISDGQEADAPFGYIDFCMRFTDQCPLGSKQAKPVTTWRYWPQMVNINRRVNRAIKPESAIRHYGRYQYWNIPKDGLGDCVDYALTKRRDLARAGIPLSDLNLAIVKLPTGALHAVLVVSTAEGDFVLDNLHQRIRLWNRDGYVFLSIMSAPSPTQWVKVVPRSRNRILANASQ